MGWFTKKTAPDTDLSTGGIRGKARIEHVEMNRFGTEAVLTRGQADRLLSGEETLMVRKLHLRIELPGLEPYTVVAKVLIPLMKSGMAQAGSVVGVLVDPKQPGRVAVDWNAPIERGSAADVIGDNPWAQKALMGMGLDPAQIAAQADSARKAAIDEMERYRQAHAAETSQPGPSGPAA